MATTRDFGVRRVRDALLRVRRERIGVYRGLFLKRLAQWPLRAVMRRLSRSFRRDPDLVAFGAVRNRLADNPAYLFLNMANANELRCVWITGSRDLAAELEQRGYDARYRWSTAGIRAAMRASFHVYGFALSDVNIWFSDGAVTLNLWHGVGVKRIQRDRTAPWDKMYGAPERSLAGRIFADDRRPPDWLVTTSPAMTEYFQSPFAIPADRCVELGYPRNDHLVNGTDPPPILVDPHIYKQLVDASVVVGYFPTWRYDSLAALPAGAPQLEDIARVVGEQGGVVLFKPHFGAASPDTANESALVSLPPPADLNAYLGLCDVLITDWSSVAADFLLLDRPIITFVPDFEDDLAKERFSVDPLTFQPGIPVRTTTALFDLLRNVRSIPCADNFPALREYYWGTPTGKACEQVADFIKTQSSLLRANPNGRPN